MRTRKIIKIVLVYAFIITGICVGYRMNIMAAGPENINVTLNRSSDFETSKRLRWYLNGNWSNTGGGRYTLYNGSNYHSTKNPGRSGSGYIVIDRPGTYRIEWSFESYNDGKTYTTYATITINDSEFNKAPVITIDNKNQITNNTGTVSITGTVQDLDNDNLTVSAKIGNVTDTQTINNTSTQKPFELTWNSSDLSQGNYTNILITVSDGFGEVTKNYTGTIQVDKTPPTKPTLSSNKNTPTNQNILITIDYSSDSSNKQYKLGGGVWTKYTAPVIVSNNQTIYARGVDLAGNISEEGSLIVNNIDKRKPNLSINIQQN